MLYTTNYVNPSFVLLKADLYKCTGLQCLRLAATRRLNTTLFALLREQKVMLVSSFNNPHHQEHGNTVYKGLSKDS